MQIKTRLIEQISITTSMDKAKIKAAKDYLDENGYTATTWGPILKGLKASGLWGIDGEKDFQDTSRISKAGRYLVRADHPILKRIDKTVYSGELSMFIMTLETMNYENIKISKKA